MRIPSANNRFLFLLAVLALSAAAAPALSGALFVHDPSPVVECDGRYYVFGTGRGIPILVSDDGFNWRREGHVFDRIPETVRALSPKNNGVDVWAPQVIPFNGEYYLYYAVSSWGSFVSVIGLATNPTLNPSDPRYKWTDRGPVVNSTAGEDLNAIDPGVVLAPDGRLWLSYGSYHGNIQLVQLNAKTGLRISPHSKVSIIADHSEASDIVYHGGYYYLFVNHGSCCKGPKSTYTIRVGRSRKVTGPYLDKTGANLADGGGSLFLGSAGRLIGPGQFGLWNDGGVEKFSCHFEGDLDRGGRPVLAIRPLLWTEDGWPKAGENVEQGVYQVRAWRTGTVLSFAQDAASAGTGSAVGLTDYIILDTQKWTIAAAGDGYYRLAVVQGDLALNVGAGGVLQVTPFTGADAQLWKIDELTNGDYRIEAKTSREAITLQESGHAVTVALQPFTGQNTQWWQIVAP
jgi:arabinan endo-1,5-alpha-L-arabinosidase